MFEYNDIERFRMIERAINKFLLWYIEWQSVNGHHTLLETNSTVMARIFMMEQLESWLDNDEHI